MKEEQIRELESQQKTGRQTEEARRKPIEEKLKYIERLYNLQSEIPKPKGIIHKSCPKCGRRLTRKEYRLKLWGCEVDWGRLSTCECGYEYGEYFCSLWDR